MLRDPDAILLRGAIEVEEQRLEARMQRGSSGAPVGWEVVKSSLARAWTACEVGETLRGWNLVHQARREQVAGFSPPELVSEALYLQEECRSGKFRAWREKAIAHQLEIVLARDPGGGWANSVETRRVALEAAMRTRDEAYENEYRDLALLRRYQGILLTIASVILVAAVLGSLFANPRFERGVEESWTALGAALSGALGGATSALQRTARRSGDRIPQRIGSLSASLSRPVIGAIAGVSVFLAVRAGVTQTSEQQVAYLLLIAFGAGFAERLVVRDPREEVRERRPTSVGQAPLPQDGRVDEPGGDGPS